MNTDDRLAGPKAIVTILAILALYAAAGWLTLGGMHG
jgi:hypothetical protein